MLAKTNFGQKIKSHLLFGDNFVSYRKIVATIKGNTTEQLQPKQKDLYEEFQKVSDNNTIISSVRTSKSTADVCVLES